MAYFPTIPTKLSSEKNLSSNLKSSVKSTGLSDFQKTSKSKWVGEPDLANRARGPTVHFLGVDSDTGQLDHRAELSGAQFAWNNKFYMLAGSLAREELTFS